MDLPRDLIDVATIYHEPVVADFAHGRAILDRFPDAARIEVPSHWNIPTLHGNAGAVEDWVRIKRSTLVLGVKKGLSLRPNGRSAHFIAPSTSNGCAMACAYCYVPRRKGFANPISLFVNVEAIGEAIRRHAGKQGPLTAPDTIDPERWVYDIGENGDLSVDALLGDGVRDLVALFRDIPNAKASFATKAVNRDLLAYEPRGKTRIRFSLMPEGIARIVDVRTAPIMERIAAIDDFVAAGYEVHVNFSPVILYEGWEADWGALFEALDAGIGPAAKAQLKAEVILLTHNAGLHAVNLGWHPKAEALLWRPDIQEAKRSEGGGDNLRYRARWKAQWIARFKALMAERIPYCQVRYAF
ncbi:radical SAM protein [Methylobacterium sp. Leaf399]|uniref:spore photoproduct lyase family protein n=1 Tax=unclassified Methylobacterium TaxID=2615210 RepID=UPI000701E9C7|nr:MULTISPECIES: spore photoproduct lyase family protein [unclassified Methylobacterium]KQP58499.1 radical SAM protein [Methylobacterium sp. Leaf108]KQT11946.1 radical SAM protein [Methylobacterium sp. Leaf399]KQT88697.1 radical SAM protein [Methylobacterium sp. Leaf466]